MAKTSPRSRVLQELLETAADLSAYGVVSKTDLARMNAKASQAVAVGRGQGHRSAAGLTRCFQPDGEAGDAVGAEATKVG